MLPLSNRSGALARLGSLPGTAPTTATPAPKSAASITPPEHADAGAAPSPEPRKIAQQRQRQRSRTP